MKRYHDVRLDVDAEFEAMTAAEKFAEDMEDDYEIDEIDEVETDEIDEAETDEIFEDEFETEE